MRWTIPAVVVAVVGAGLGTRLAASFLHAPFGTLQEATAGRPTLLFVFQAADCPSYRELISRWNTLHARGVLRVRGVGLHMAGDSHRRELLMRRSGIRFPVRFDLARAAERLILRLGYDRTPVSILLDGRGRPRLALAPPAGPILWEGAARWLEEYGGQLPPRNADRP